MTIIINNDIFSSFFSQRQSAGQSNAAATTSHSTSVTQTLKGHVSKTGCLITKSQLPILHSFDTLFYTCLMLILQCFVKVLDLDF